MDARGIFLLLLPLLLFFQNYAIAFAISGSMEPAIMTGDLVVYKLLPRSESPVIGDIVLFYSPKVDHPVVHRIIQAQGGGGGGGYVTKGDANRMADCEFLYPGSTLSRENIYGRVVQIIPLYGVLSRPFTLWGEMSNGYGGVLRKLFMYVYFPYEIYKAPTWMERATLVLFGIGVRRMYPAS